MSSIHYINSDVLDIREIVSIIEENKTLQLSEEAISNISNARNYLDKKQDLNEKPVYGINTGFGSLCNIKIANDQLAQLQENLVLSHACGTGPQVRQEIVQIMLLLKIQSLSYGHSGISLMVVNRLIDLYNNQIYPIILEQGSLGASGDLAPLAHLSLPLLGKGEVSFKGELMPTSKIMAQMNWEPLELQSKEGLALLNGTQFMSAHAVYALIETFKISWLADIISAASLEGFDCNMSPFDASVHEVRPHRGQIKTADRIRTLLEGSEIGRAEKKNVQDPYSFRCIPQVHGASKDTFHFVYQCVKTEINSVTDNPNIFVKEDKIISGGNFHGQPIALPMDYLAIALSELGNISERRIYQLVSGLRELPSFLVDNPGINSGFMIPQYTAASIVSQNKLLCMPASVDSIVSSNGQEDHVSMGANAATKLVRVVDNVKTILAIELMNASQALYFREPIKSSQFIQEFIHAFRAHVPIIKDDTLMATEIKNAILFLESYQFQEDIFRL